MTDNPQRPHNNHLTLAALITYAGYNNWLVVSSYVTPLSDQQLGELIKDLKDRVEGGHYEPTHPFNYTEGLWLRGMKDLLSYCQAEKSRRFRIRDVGELHKRRL